MIASLLATRAEAVAKPTQSLKRARDEDADEFAIKVTVFEEFTGFRRDEFTECMVVAQSDWIIDGDDRAVAKTLSGQYWRIGKLDGSLVFRQECTCHIYWSLFVSVGRDATGNGRQRV